jgi:hypothetical protein
MMAVNTWGPGPGFRLQKTSNIAKIQQSNSAAKVRDGGDVEAAQQEGG